MPDSVEQPAPVSTTRRAACRIKFASRVTSAASVVSRTSCIMPYYSGYNRPMQAHIDPDLRLALGRGLIGWYVANGRDLPWRRTTDPYAILVSEVLLQQT